MLGTRPVNTARMRDDPTSVIGWYDILRLLPIAAFKPKQWPPTTVSHMFLLREKHPSVKNYAS